MDYIYPDHKIRTSEKAILDTYNPNEDARDRATDGAREGAVEGATDGATDVILEGACC